MRRLIMTAAATALLFLLAAVPASADFGLSSMDVDFTNQDGTPAILAGFHPFAATTSFVVNSKEHPEKGVPVVDGALRNLDIVLPAGLAGNPTAVPHCENLDFLSEVAGHSGCADSTAVGMLTAEIGGGTGIPGTETVSIHNMQPSPGVAAKIGFWVGGVPTTVNFGVNPTYPYNVIATLRNAPQIVEVLSSVTTVWGNPADPVHDPDRGNCAYLGVSGSCAANIPVRPFITLPRSCTGSLSTTFRALSWWSGDPLEPGPPAFFEGSASSEAMEECAGLRFSPSLDARPSTERAGSASGLEVQLDVSDEGLGDPEGRAHSDIKKTVVTFPEGMTINPSQAEGLEACSEAALARETASSQFGEGCPAASKIGTVEVETPLLEGRTLDGSVFVAEPYTNRFGTLLAVYMTVKEPELGIGIRLASKVEPHPETGQLVATVDDMPQLPFSQARLRLREGGRSPLITPNRCGAHTTEAVLTPWSNPASPLTTTSSFQITRGVDGGPCPPVGPPPFAPGFSAGTLNNAAGAHSPLLMRLTRRDGDQDLTRFSSILPQGLLPKLVGVDKCPQAQIEAAKTRFGREELASPSCPPNSKIGQVAAGAGVGSQLTYVRGAIYLAGPYKGAPISAAVVTPAVAGPFDVGTVVVQVGLNVDPKSAEGLIDGSASDPIPHILAGIPLRVRDLQVSTDRPSFTLNPTSCREMAVAASIWGGGLDPFSLADDAPVSRSARFRAAHCASLGFAPRLTFALKGGTDRAAHPSLTATLRPRPGDANLKRAVVRFPRSTFLDQGHIRTVCTRVQFAADNCPAASIYGRVKAFTPLLEEPFEGPVYLRSSDNLLPDLVFDLHGLVDIEVSARTDSVKGRLRVLFPAVPDAPISKAVVRMQGGKKGLLVNSRDICAPVPRAIVDLEAHNAKRHKSRPLLRAQDCSGGEKSRKRTNS